MNTDRKKAVRISEGNRFEGRWAVLGQMHTDDTWKQFYASKTLAEAHEDFERAAAIHPPGGVGTSVRLCYGEDNPAVYKKMAQVGEIREERLLPVEPASASLEAEESGWRRELAVDEMDEADLDCLGHESLEGPIGNVVYCDGTCRTGRRLIKPEPVAQVAEMVRPIMQGLPYDEYRKQHQYYDPSRDALLNKVCRNPKGCGCLVVGEGTLQAPIEILFCSIHDPALRQQRDEMANALESVRDWTLDESHGTAEQRLLLIQNVAIAALQKVRRG